jgi:hypothetical protein
MPTDLRIVVPNRPGAAREIFAAVAAEDINIEGVCGDIRPGEKWGYIHILVEDVATAKRVVEDAGFEITSMHEVELLPIENRPGALADTFQGFAEKGISVDVLYLGFGDRLVIGTEEMHPERPGVKMSDVKFP